MGKHNQESNVQPTQANVDQAIASAVSAGELPVQPDSLLAGQGLLGKAVRALVGARMQTVFLTEFDESSNTYWGLAVRCNPAEGSDKMPKFEAVSGLRPYPYSTRPNYSFQYVTPGSDESVLINIAHDNLVARQGGGAAPDSSSEGGNG